MFSPRCHTHVRTNGLGTVTTAETGFLLATNPDHVRAPDAAFVSRERDEAAVPVSGFFPGPPDLAVEIISPNDRYTEVYEKVDEWLEAGAGMVVLVNPRNRTATVRVARREPGNPRRGRYAGRRRCRARLADGGIGYFRKLTCEQRHAELDSESMSLGYRFGLSP